MKGDPRSYDKEFITTQIQTGVHIFGVHAVKFLKQSYKIGHVLMMNIWGTYIMSTFFCYEMYQEKHNMSQYLIENADLHSNALFEGYMLDIEAYNWGLLYFKNMELSSIPNFRILAKILVMKEIRDILDVIISIEKDIINGPPSTVPS